jgi:hypothetical protein
MNSVKNLAPLLVAKLINLNNIFDETEPQEQCQAVIVRSSLVANNLASSQFDFTGTNPPFIPPDTMKHILSIFPCIQVLLVDLPSVDPESDGGQLLAHKEFFSGSQSAGIVELCHIQTHIQEGLYALSLNVAPFDSDASPCAPIMYPLKRFK